MADTVLVTGGAGYIGSTVAADLVRAGYRVVVFDSLIKGHRAAVPPEAKLVVGDLADEPAVDAVLAAEKPVAVLHFAAFIEAGESMRAPERFFRNNTANTLQLLERMLAHGVRALVFSSTAAVYGDPIRTPIQEDDRLQPTNAYGESKLLVERVLDWYANIHGLRSVSLRYFNAAGAATGAAAGDAANAVGERGEDHEPETHLIPLMLRVALGKRDGIEIFGTDYPTPDGTCIRDYIHISDLASAHVLALAALRRDDAGPARRVYNLGNGTGFSVRDVLATARRVTGHAIPARESPRRPGDPAVLVAGSDKIRRELGWTPRHPDLESIVAGAWEWHRRRPDGYGDR